MLTIFSTRTCVFCTQVEKLCQMKGVAYEKVYIDDDVEKRQELFEKTGHLSVPVTTDGSKYVVGWNIGELMRLIAVQ